MPKSKVFIQNEFDLRFQRFLLETFEKKKVANPRFSLRAFSRLVDIDQSLLSKILKGKKAIGAATMLRVIQTLGGPEDLITEFISYKRDTLAYNEVTEEKFSRLANWKYFAILELIHLEGFQFTPENIAQKLKVSAEEALGLLSQLEATGFLKKTAEKFEVIGGSNTWASVSQASEARVQFQRSIHEESLRSLETVPFQYRDHSSTLFTINKSDVEAYREIIKETRRKLADLFMKSKKHDEVFVLSISLFPVTLEEKP